MKREIIKTDNYLLVVDDDSDIKVHGYYLRYSTKVLRCTDMKWVFNDALNKNEIIITSDSSGDPYDRSKHFLKKIISHLPLNGAPYLDGVDRLPPSWRDSGDKDDVEQLAEEHAEHQFKGISDRTSMFECKNDFKSGYQEAREKYKFTEEDMRKAIIMSSLSTVDFIPDRCDVIIQTIQQPKYPIAFECEVELVFYPANMPKEGEERPPYRPKIIINSEGRTEWVGKYIYE